MWLFYWPWYFPLENLFLQTSMVRYTLVFVNSSQHQSTPPEKYKICVYACKLTFVHTWAYTHTHTHTHVSAHLKYASENISHTCVQSYIINVFIPIHTIRSSDRSFMVALLIYFSFQLVVHIWCKQMSWYVLWNGAYKGFLAANRKEKCK